jgi:hypothetical protein
VAVSEVTAAVSEVTAAAPGGRAVKSARSRLGAAVSPRPRRPESKSHMAAHAKEDRHVATRPDAFCGQLRVCTGSRAPHRTDDPYSVTAKPELPGVGALPHTNVAM